MAKYGTDYWKDFDAAWYLDTYYVRVGGCEEEGDFLAFVLNEIHTIFDSGRNFVIHVHFDDFCSCKKPNVLFSSFSLNESSIKRLTSFHVLSFF